MATAYLITGDDTTAYPIAGKTIVGRGEQVDLVLSDISVSRRHASVHLDGVTVVVSDLDSANGTFVNGERVHEGTRVKDGDVVRFGHVDARVSIVESREPDEAMTPTELHTPAD